MTRLADGTVRTGAIDRVGDALLTDTGYAGAARGKVLGNSYVAGGALVARFDADIFPTGAATLPGRPGCGSAATPDLAGLAVAAFCFPEGREQRR